MQKLTASVPTRELVEIQNARLTPSLFKHSQECNRICKWFIWALQFRGPRLGNCTCLNPIASSDSWISTLSPVPDFYVSWPLDASLECCQGTEDRYVHRTLLSFCSWNPAFSRVPYVNARKQVFSLKPKVHPYFHPIYSQILANSSWTLLFLSVSSLSLIDKILLESSVWYSHNREIFLCARSFLPQVFSYLCACLLCKNSPPFFFYSPAHILNKYLSLYYVPISQT